MNRFRHADVFRPARALLASVLGCLLLFAVFHRVEHVSCDPHHAEHPCLICTLGKAPVEPAVGASPSTAWQPGFVTQAPAQKDFVPSSFPALPPGRAPPA